MSTQDNRPESQQAETGAQTPKKAVASRAKTATKTSASTTTKTAPKSAKPSKSASTATSDTAAQKPLAKTAKSSGEKPKTAAKKPAGSQPAAAKNQSVKKTPIKKDLSKNSSEKSRSEKDNATSKAPVKKSTDSKAPTATAEPAPTQAIADKGAIAEMPKEPGLSPQAPSPVRHVAKTRMAPSNSELWPLLKHKAPLYWRLTRMHKPIGSLLLLWPTLWSLWLAAKGVPSLKNLAIFVLGVLVMRSAGCVINDFADRKVDGHVKRTQDRPLATGQVSAREAVVLFLCLSLLAFGLVLLTNPLTIQLSVGGLLLAFCYPFMKRYTHLPQVVLGAAFGWGIPMAYAAETNSLPDAIWLVYIANLLWTVAYDTFYAMVDRDDDIKIGVKSTAILFGEQDRLITAVLQGLALYSLYLVGDDFHLGGFYWLGLAVAAGLCIYQQWLIRFRAREACFKAFLNNNWVGAAVFAGLVIDLTVKS